MGVYIHGMEMPKSKATVYYAYIVVSPDGHASIVVDNEDGLDSTEYTLVPVPDHGRQDGLYSKYFVIKTETGEIVQDCFVLRPQKDKAAVAALLLYAKETENQELSSDIRGWLSTIIPADGADGKDTNVHAREEGVPKAYVDKEAFSRRLSELIRAFEPCPDKYDTAVLIKSVFDSFPYISVLEGKDGVI